jgi:membrane protease YdiL (CAAX protease family)
MTDNPQQKKPTYNSFLANHIPIAIIATVVGYILLGVLEFIPAGKVIPPLLYFVVLGIVALVLMPFVIGLPHGRKSFNEYCHDIRLLPMRPLDRNIILGLLLALLTLTGILLATLATGHFALDWSLLPAVRWLKGLTRGIWEEVFFRGIILALFIRLYPGRTKQAVFWTTFVFTLCHFKEVSLEQLVELVSIFFMGLLFVYVILKTGSLLPAMIFHYVHDIFINLVQNAPGVDPTIRLVLFYAGFWTALIIGALLTRLIVERWPDMPKQPEFAGG